MTTLDNDRIHGWRAIADFLQRDERTAKRWEKQRGLPVHRIPGEGRANVYVHRSEVEDWLRQSDGHHPPVSVPEEPVYADSLKEEIQAREVGEDASPTESAGGSAEAIPHDVGQESSVRPEAPYLAGRAAFRPSQHVSLLVSAFGLLLLLSASAVRFFHVGPLESIMFASESFQPEPTTQASDKAVEEMYFRGVYLCEQRSPAALTSAKELFEAAIARDPHYAPSYAGLAKAYLLLREYAMMPQEEAYERAKEAAEHAVRLDPNQADAHAALGFIDFFWLWKAADAEREFAFATQLDGRSALAHHWYGSMLMHQGRYVEALAQLDVAQRLDPASAAILATKALTLGFGGHKDQGMQLLEAMDGAGKETAVMHRNLAYLSLVTPRDPGRILREYQRFAEMRGDKESTDRLLAAADTFAAKGERAMWETMLRDEQRSHPRAAHPSYLMAQADANLGHEDVAIRELTQLVEDHDDRMVGLVLEPAFLPLHRNAAFVRLAERVGLLYPVVATR